MHYSHLDCPAVFFVTDATVQDTVKKFLDAVVSLCERSGNDWYRVYLIRKLSSQRGVEVVQRMVKEPQFRWLFPVEVHQQAHKVILML